MAPITNFNDIVMLEKNGLETIMAMRREVRQRDKPFNIDELVKLLRTILWPGGSPAP